MLNLKIITPEKTSFEATAKSVSFRTHEGDVTVLPGHEPFMGILKNESTVNILDESENKQAYIVIEGLVRVSEDKVTITAEIAEKPEELDLMLKNRAKELAKNKAKEDKSNMDISRAEYNLRKTLVRNEGSAYSVLYNPESGDAGKDE